MVAVVGPGVVVVAVVGPGVVGPGVVGPGVVGGRSVSKLYNIYVPRNLGICAISRLRCAFSES